MWPCKNKGEDARLYAAVEAVSDFACALGINIPTGKDSLSMTQKYKDGVVFAPGTVIISASGEVTDVRKGITPNLLKEPGTSLIYISLSESPLTLGGSSFAQILNKLGNDTPDIANAEQFKNTFNAVQYLVQNNMILAGHDVSSGGLITTLLEMCFSENDIAINASLDGLNEASLVTALFAENPALVIQVRDASEIQKLLEKQGVKSIVLGSVVAGNNLQITLGGIERKFDIASLRDVWFKTSFLLDERQTAPGYARERLKITKTTVLNLTFRQISPDPWMLTESVTEREKAAVSKRPSFVRKG